MPEPRSQSRSDRARGRRPASTALLVAVALIVVATGCSSNPTIGAENFAAAQQRIVALVNATGEAIGAPAEFTPAHKANPLPCYKKVLGYTVKHLSANHAELPIPITIAGTVDGPALLPRVERYWKSRGFVIDRRGLTDPRFPKLETHVGDDLLVATGFKNAHEMTLYGVSPCVKS
jgi:hypothetical protein